MPTQLTAIVVADDDPHMLRLEARNLQLAGYRVVEAHDGQEALERITAILPDLVLLGVTLRKRDGFAVTQAVRMLSWVPIILVSAHGQAQDKIRGFDLGADDFLAKPFSVDELLARVRAVLRRTQLGDVWDQAWGTGRVTVGDLEIDFLHHRVTQAGREIHLTAIEYGLLAELAAHAGRIVTREWLLERVWGPVYMGEHHLLQVTINRLRHKIEPDVDGPHYLQTKPGVGYLLMLPQEHEGSPRSGIAVASRV